MELSFCVCGTSEGFSEAGVGAGARISGISSDGVIVIVGVADVVAESGAADAGACEVLALEVEAAPLAEATGGAVPNAGCGCPIGAPVNALPTDPGGRTLRTLVSSSIHLCTAVLTFSRTLNLSSIASRVRRSNRPSCSSVNVDGNVLKFGLKLREDDAAAALAECV